MAITISDLALDKDYVDGDILTEDDLDAALIDADAGSVQGYVNTYVKDNLLQLAKDVMPAEWVFNDDAAQSVTNTVFDKQSSTMTYDSGDIDIEITTDAAFEAVNATNAKVTFTPEYKGKYKITWHFCHLIMGKVATDVIARVKFKVSDGTTDSPIAVVYYDEQSTGAGDERTKIYPFTLSVVIDVLDTATDVDVYLYKYNVTMTNVTYNKVCASEANGQLYAQVEKI